jgi:hypothetical protein
MNAVKSSCFCWTIPGYAPVIHDIKEVAQQPSFAYCRNRLFLSQRLRVLSKSACSRTYLSQFSWLSAQFLQLRVLGFRDRYSLFLSSLTGSFAGSLDFAASFLSAPLPFFLLFP